MHAGTAASRCTKIVGKKAMRGVFSFCDACRHTLVPTNQLLLLGAMP